MTQRLQVYETEQVRVTFDPKLCAHSGVCLKRLPEVFDISKRDWIDPTKATSHEVMQAVAKCPSGALRASLVTSVHHVLPDPPDRESPAVPGPDTMRITARTNASLLIEGPFEVCDADGNVLRSGDRCSLCRCGHSKNKPFCDGSHRQAEWRSE